MYENDELSLDHEEMGRMGRIFWDRDVLLLTDLFEIDATLKYLIRQYQIGFNTSFSPRLSLEEVFGASSSSASCTGIKTAAYHSLRYSCLRFQRMMGCNTGSPGVKLQL